MSSVTLPHDDFYTPQLAAFFYRVPRRAIQISSIKSPCVVKKIKRKQ